MRRLAFDARGRRVKRDRNASEDGDSKPSPRQRRRASAFASLHYDFHAAVILTPLRVIASVVEHVVNAVAVWQRLSRRPHCFSMRCMLPDSFSARFGLLLWRDRLNFVLVLFFINLRYHHSLWHLIHRR